MRESDIPAELLNKLKAVTGKRARIVVEHILKHGAITTEDIEAYGYKHPPRAIRDVREQGIPLITKQVKSSGGRTIAEYQLGELSDIKGGKLQGRKTFSKKFKETLHAHSNDRCAICSASFETRYLQIDHRIPYEIAGDTDYQTRNIADYMLLCGSCNRAKSWSCEQCPNWQTKLSQVCQQCYWASPENYTHIALHEVRRVDIIWHEDEIEVYEELKEIAEQLTMPMPQYIKQIIQEALQDSKTE